MNIIVIGSKDWVDYNTVIRSLTVEVQDWNYDRPEDDRLVFWHTGADGAERMVAEWVGKVEDLAKQKGKSIKDKVFYSQNQDKFGELLESGIMDKALVFSKNKDKRGAIFAERAKEYGVPVKVIEW